MSDRAERLFNQGKRKLSQREEETITPTRGTDGSQSYVRRGIIERMGGGSAVTKAGNRAIKTAATQGNMGKVWGMVSRAERDTRK
jgi:hypothetical protein